MSFSIRRQVLESNLFPEIIDRRRLEASSPVLSTILELEAENISGARIYNENVL